MGENIALRPALESDRSNIFHWLAESNLTPSMMGPPHFPEYPPPSWELFCEEFPASIFNASGDGKGRHFIILAEGEEVGTVGYDLLDKVKDRVVLDVWLRSEADCGRGYGSDALTTLCRHIHSQYGITTFIISPSARNLRAIAAYRKAGFKIVKTLAKAEQVEVFGMFEYEDSLFMVKKISGR